MLGSGVATEVYAEQDSQKWAGYFNAGGEAREGHTPEEVEQGIYDELEKLKTRRGARRGIAESEKQLRRRRIPPALGQLSRS